MERAKIVNFLLEKAANKNFSILDVRRELEKNNFDEQEIRIIIKLVDSEIQRSLKRKSALKKSKELMWLGGIVTAVGLFITIGTYVGIIPMKNHFLLTYGPILGGLSILFFGVGKRNLN